MTLNEYLRTEGAMTVAELRIAIGARNDDQIRQWQHGYAGRIPSPENCVVIERKTKGLVRRWDLRPDDWWKIWPELIGKKGAPAIPTQEAA